MHFRVNVCGSWRERQHPGEQVAASSFPPNDTVTLDLGLVSNRRRAYTVASVLSYVCPLCQRRVDARREGLFFEADLSDTKGFGKATRISRLGLMHHPRRIVVVATFFRSRCSWATLSGV